MRNFKVWMQEILDAEYELVMNTTRNMWNQSVQARLKWFFEHKVQEQKILTDFAK